MRFAPAPEYQRVPDAGPAAQALRGGAARDARDRARWSATRDPDAVVADILTLAAALAAELRGRPWATLVPHVLPVGEPGFPPYSVGARLPRTPARGRTVGRRSTRCSPAAQQLGRGELNEARARVGLPPLDHAPRRHLAASSRWWRPSPSSSTRARCAGPARRSPARCCGSRPSATWSCRRATTRWCSWRRAPRRTPSSGLLRAALEGLARPARARARHHEPAAAGAAAARAAQRAARRLGLLRAHDAALRRRRLPRGPRHDRARAGLRRAAWSPAPRRATWPRTPRGSTGPAWACSLPRRLTDAARDPAGGAARARRAGAPRARARELAAWLAQHDPADRAAELVEGLAVRHTN